MPFMFLSFMTLKKDVVDTSIIKIDILVPLVYG